MAVANWSSGAMMKAVLLPLILVLLAVAAGASSAEDGGAVAKSGGRFSETPVGRKLLQIGGCGTGSAPNYSCKVFLPGAKNATCCPDLFGITQACYDVGDAWLDKCGSCTTKCKIGTQVCCSGVCIDFLTDKKNCGICGNRCPGSLNCTLGFCGY